MERRKFIEKATLSTSSLMLLSPFTACSNDNEIVPITTDKKILIIGAGMAGLGAARYFKERGVAVTVIEAQDKIGGRLKTDRSLGLAFDEGASWIHGPRRNPITDIAEAAGANTFETDDDNVKVYDVDGAAYSDDTLTEAEEEFEEALYALQGDVNTSLEEVFYRQYPQYVDNRLWTYMLSAYLEFDTGGDIGELSSLDFYDDEAFRGADLIITDGFDQLTTYLVTDIDIRLNTKVSSIDYSGELVQVNTSSESYEADFVLLTVPLGVLKADVISFTPALSSPIAQAIEKLKMGSVNKYLCVWDAPFWNTDLQYIGYSAETKGKFNYFLNVKKFSEMYALMTFTFGDYSELAESMSDAEITDEIMVHLRSIYGQDIPAPTHMLRTKWVTNEYSFGAYSFASNGTRTTDFESFERPIDDKLFFAGEHTSRDYRGTVHGAYLSGIREAEKIADML